MSTRKASEGEEPPIERREQLVAPMQAGEKPPANWRIGTEHEKLVYRTADHAAPSYDEPGRNPRHPAANAPVRLGVGRGRAATSSRFPAPTATSASSPPGQLELSGAPLDNLHQTCAETGRHSTRSRRSARSAGVGFLGLGMWPDKRRDELPVMPKGRYAIMLRHMPASARLGLDMMLRTCTIQVNSTTAPKPTWRRSSASASRCSRSPPRCSPTRRSPRQAQRHALLPQPHLVRHRPAPHRHAAVRVRDGFGYERYVDYMLDVPMYFVFRDGKYIDAAGPELPRFPRRASSPRCRANCRPRATGSTISRPPSPKCGSSRSSRCAAPTVGPWNRICALPALWVGLLYDEARARCGDGDLVSTGRWTSAKALAQRRARSSRSTRRSRAAASCSTLRPRGAADRARRASWHAARLNKAGDSEAGFLEPLEEIVASGKVPAQRLLDKFHGEWGGGHRPRYEESF
jgi:glutamate--cysteine ligase